MEINRLLFAVIFCQLAIGICNADEPKKKEASFAETIENCDLIEGLFNLYQDRENGTVYMAVRNDQLDKEFIHFAYVLDGLVDLRMFRGKFLNQKVFSFRRWYKKLELVFHNTGFYFDPENALSKAAEANISEAVVVSLNIVATSEDKTAYLVKADDLFLQELLSMIKPASKEGEKKDSLKFGNLSKERTRFDAVRNYPQNTLLRVNYVYHNNQVKAWGDDDVTDARYITAKVQHALVAIPENNYRSRLEDPRVGYFTTRKTDLTAVKSANYLDVIHRWHLEKKQPGQSFSEPKEPITWWVENTTPVELRELIKLAVESWNPAFESAGYKKAVVCKFQPDDADWDAGDIRYNVIRWTSSPKPPFGGYGPSFVNPKTGQILGADIMLEYVYLTYRARLNNLLQKTEPLYMDRNRFPFNRQQSNLHANQSWCSAALNQQESTIAARASLLVAGSSKLELTKMVEQALFQLVLHEVGHTLGLTHNFLASSLHSPDKLNDTEKTKRLGLTSSVMDYTPANIAPSKDLQGQYFTNVPGPYDHWAIRYGYTATTPKNEAEVLAEILAESTKPEHAFGHDGDDMRSPGRGIDPRIMINDLSSDPIKYATDSMDRIQKTMSKLVEKFPTDGDSYHEMQNAVSSLLRTYERSAEVLSRYVGGVYIDRSMHGQEGASGKPYTPVAKEDQLRAMAAIRNYTMKNGAFKFIDPNLIAHLQIQRRGFSNMELKNNEDPKIHSNVRSIQDGVLDHLLHRNTLQRIIDTSLYGNDLSIDEVMASLHAGVFKGEADSFRKNLQVNYTKRLIGISGLTEKSSHPVQAQSLAVFYLEKIEAEVKAGNSPHEVHLRRLVQNALAGQ